MLRDSQRRARTAALAATGTPPWGSRGSKAAAVYENVGPGLCLRLGVLSERVSLPADFGLRKPEEAFHVMSCWCLGFACPEPENQVWGSYRSALGRVGT